MAPGHRGRVQLWDKVIYSRVESPPLDLSLTNTLWQESIANRGGDLEPYSFKLEELDLLLNMFRFSFKFGKYKTQPTRIKAIKHSRTDHTLYLMDASIEIN